MAVDERHGSFWVQAKLPQRILSCEKLAVMLFLWQSLCGIWLQGKGNLEMRDFSPVIRKLSHSSFFPFKVIPTRWGQALSFKVRSNSFGSSRYGLHLISFMGILWKCKKNGNIQVFVIYHMAMHSFNSHMVLLFSVLSGRLLHSMLWLLKCLALVV